MAERTKKISLIIEKEANHLGNGEYDLTARHIKQKPLPHPLVQFLEALGMTGWTKIPFNFLVFNPKRVYDGYLNLVNCELIIH